MVVSGYNFKTVSWLGFLDKVTKITKQTWSRSILLKEIWFLWKLNQGNEHACQLMYASWTNSNTKHYTKSKSRMLFAAIGKTFLLKGHSIKFNCKKLQLDTLNKHNKFKLRINSSVKIISIFCRLTSNFKVHMTGWTTYFTYNSLAWL